jgi:hypothetical protein
MPDARVVLAQRFRATEQAHHQAFAVLPHDTLAAALREVDIEMRAQAPAADWTLYYADWFLDRHATAEARVGPPE